MLCERCRTSMIYFCKNSVHGWACKNCGWEVITTYIDQMHQDRTEYCIYIKRMKIIDKDKIKLVAEISGVNYIMARKMLWEGEFCVQKAKAKDIKSIIDKLKNADIPFEVVPEFYYE